MAYSIVQGDLEPAMPIQLLADDEPYSLIGDETVTLKIETPTGEIREKTLDIVTADTGDLEAVWVDGDTDDVGAYFGQVEVLAVGATAPRTFPNNGAFIIWTVYRRLGED